MCGYSVHRSCGLCHLLRYILHSKNSKLYAVERLLLRTFLLQAPIPLKCFIDGSEPVSRDLRGAAEAKGTITKGSIKKHTFRRLQWILKASGGSPANGRQRIW